MAIIQSGLKIVFIIEEFYRRNKIFPTVQHISQKSKYPQPYVQELLAREDVQHALDIRGIPWESRDGLTPDQLNAAAVLLNVNDRRSNSTKLAELGIKSSTYRGWLKDSKFLAYIQSQANELFRESSHEAKIAFMKKVNEGDMKAIRMYFEMSGEYVPAAAKNDSLSEDMLKARVVRLLESVEKNVKDPAVRQAIAADFAGITAVPIANLPSVGDSISSIGNSTQSVGEKVAAEKEIWEE